jgi:hypothetical protein
MTIVTTTSCVVPIPASPVEDGDGGVRSDTPTVITATPYDFPGPLSLNPLSPEQFTVTLRDADIQDTLYVRVFRDYQKAALGFLDQREVPNDPDLGRLDRQVTLLTNNWCNGINDTEGQLVFDVVVADQPFDNDNTTVPEYRAVINGGRSSVRSWVGRCVPPL